MSGPYYRDESVTLWHGDCLDVLATLPDASVDAVVTDPPYGLEFMGKDWDGADGFRRSLNPADAGRESVFGRTSRTSPEYRAPHLFGSWCELWARECLRVLKPGGHMLAFGGSRTWHRLASAVEDAGFEVRDSIAWLYGSGFPKSRNLDGAWQGWGTALKPAFEPIVVARKPLAGTVAGNVLAHGTGALNIDGCRVEYTSKADKASARPGGSATSRPGALAGKAQICDANSGSTERSTSAPTKESSANSTMTEPAPTATGSPRKPFTPTEAAGRWPTNVVLDDTQAAALDAQSGTLTSGSGIKAPEGKTHGFADGRTSVRHDGDKLYAGDTGGASRFFPTFRYEAKAPTAERPTYFAPTCVCEDAWPTTSPGRVTSATAAADECSTSKSGSSTTADPSPTDGRFTTSTVTNETTTPTTCAPSTPSPISASTPGANCATASGGSPAASVASSSQSARPTGTSAVRAGHSTGGAAPATSRVWSATSVCGSCGAPTRREAHATVKPLDLMRWLVRLVTPPGGVVLDPFLGSGTTAEACILEGFRCIGIEREPAYLPLAVARLSKPLQVGLDFGESA